MASIVDHREGRSEVKMDQLQAQKYEEIIDMLLAAGYFRARISALSQFDKIIGGLTWCITASNIDVDIDLFFEEEAQIKQKIELGERIEEALIRMKCPFPLQSYEIRGLNTPNIYPVIQWLVKKVIETRAETGDLLRLFSESRFRSAGYDLGARDPVKAPSPAALTFVSEVAERYKPQRRYRRGAAKAFQDEESRVQATLLEYGYKGTSSFIPPEGDGEGEGGKRRKKFDDEQDRLKEQEEATRAERERMEAVMRTLASIEGAGNVSTNKLGSLVGTDADFIREIAGEYAKKSSDMDLNEAQLQQYFGAELHKRQVDSRQKQIEREKEKIGELREQYQELDAKMTQLQEDHARRSALNKRIQQEIEKMQALETDENAEVLKTLRSLVALNESLKKQEQDFRQTCKKQLQELQGMIHALTNQSPDDDEVKRLQLVDETYQSDKAKLQEIRQLAAKKNREIAMVQRKIDEIPSRTELQQYQRQFVELYEQVSSKFTETRKYYNSYNTLNDTKQFLQKEVSILLSIDENYQTAVSSKQNKEKLAESLKGIIDGVNKNVTKVEARLVEEKQKKDLLDADYKSALEKERDYYKMTKEFLDECDKNRQLLARLEE